MTNKTIARSRAAIGALDTVPMQLAALDDMNVPALAKRYLELYGEPTRSRNKDYLRKRLKWRIQELAEGGLSQGAIARIHQLGDQMPERWRMRQNQGLVGTAVSAPASTVASQVLQPVEPRDPRVPPAGTILRRVFDGKTYEVAVCPEGFEYEGRRYKSLSAIATEIAGTRWNGFLFFGLKKRGESAREERAA